jgi:hypothetical protein
MGVLSSLPIVSAGNLCCCLWVVSGGLVAAYVLQQSTPVGITAADGALAGLVAGLAGAVIQFIISLPLDILMLPIERAMAFRLFDFAQNMSPELRDMFDRFARRDEPVSFLLLLSRRVIVLLFMLCIGAAFSTIGGVIGAGLFARKPEPAGTIDVPPAS